MREGGNKIHMGIGNCTKTRNKLPFTLESVEVIGSNFSVRHTVNEICPNETISEKLLIGNDRIY